MAQQRAHAPGVQADEHKTDSGSEAGIERSQDDPENIVDQAEQALDAEDEAEPKQSARERDANSFHDHINELRANLNESAAHAEGGKGNQRLEALKSVQDAVQRISARSGAEPGSNPVGDSLQSAIEKIRAAQGDETAVEASAASSEPEAPSPQEPVPVPRASSRPARESRLSTSQPDAGGRRFSDIVAMTARLSDRLGKFEQTVTERFDQLADPTAVARQIGLLTETVGQLSQMVKKTGDTSRIEAKLAEFAAAGHDEQGLEQLAGRLERLNESVRKLADIQVRQVRSHPEEEGAADSGFAEYIESSIRGIYDKLDVLERAAPMPAEDMERLAAGMSSLVDALEHSEDAHAINEDVIARINAIGEYVETLEPSEGSTGFTDLKQEISTLRRYMVEAFEPRFDAIEDRIQDLSNRISAGGEGIGQELLQEQFKLLVAKVDAAATELTEMSRKQAEAAERELPDMAELADIIAAKTAAEVTAQKPASDTIGVSNIAVSALRESIAQVDRRLDNLQDTLKRLARSQGGSALPGAAPIRPKAPEATSREVPATAVSAPSVSSPIDQPPPTPAPAAYAPQGGAELPPKPVSSLGENADDIFKRAAEKAVDTRPQSDKPAHEETREASPVSRESFIEAARRAAQRSSEASVLDANNGFLGKALARLTRKDEHDAEDTAEDETEAAETPVAIESDDDKASGPSADEVVIDEPHFDESEDDEPRGFLERHSKPILLAASFVAVGLMTLNLVSQRLGPDNVDGIETASIAKSPAAADTAPAMPETLPAMTPDIGLEPGEAPAPTDVRAVGAVADPTIDTTGAEMLPDDAAMPMAGNGIDPMSTASLGDSEALALELGPQALRDAATAGDPRAQFEIASIYTDGRVVAQNHEAAAMWYAKAAMDGYAPAQYRLGNLYENGRGVELDYIQARQWYQSAAEAGNRMAMHNLAALYAGGQLDTQDFASAALWFERAAQLGVKDSQFNLGMLFARGLGVDQDFVQSYKWFSIAAQGGDADAANARDDIARSLDAGALSRAQALADAWRAGTLDIAANYAPIGSWSEGFNAGEAVTDPTVIAQVQEVLSTLGYDVGVPDGLFGPKTADAIRAFEAAVGMSETGEINPRLLAVLGSQPV